MRKLSVLLVLAVAGVLLLIGFAAASDIGGIQPNSTSFTVRLMSDIGGIQPQAVKRATPSAKEQPRTA